MYRRKHKNKLILARIALIFVLLIGTVWFFKNGKKALGVNLDSGGVAKSLSSVLGVQIQRVSDMALQKLKGAGEWQEKSKIQNPKSKIERKVNFKFGVMADSHEDTRYFPKILSQLKERELDFIVHLGDSSNSGDLEKLQEVKSLLDGTGLSYLVIPGDHDYNWEPTHNLANFEKVFQSVQGSDVKLQGEEVEAGSWSSIEDGFYFQFQYKGATLIFLDTSDNQIGISSKQFEWLKKTLEDSKHFESKMPTFILTHAPPFAPYFPDKEVIQGQDLLKILSGFKIDQILTGNTHLFDHYLEAASGIEITTVGAAGSYKNPLPQWTEVVVYDDGSFEIEPRPLIEVTIANQL